MISFEKLIKFFTGVSFMAGLFFFSMFLPAVALLIDGQFQNSVIATILTVSFIFTIGILVEHIGDNPFIVIVLSSMVTSSLVICLMINIAVGLILVALQIAIYGIVTSEYLQKLNDDVYTIMKHRSDLFKKCIKIEKSKQKP